MDVTDAAPPIATLRCNGCGEIKPVTDYYEIGKSLAAPGHEMYRRQPCKPCYRALRRDRYAIDGVKDKSSAEPVGRNDKLTLAQYREMHEIQCGKCAACGRPAQGHRLNVDHCQATGVVRELLCTWCNSALVWARDDPRRLRDLIAYLERHGITDTQPDTSVT